MNNTNYIAIDIGLKGGIATRFGTTPMPVKKIIDKQTRYILDLDKNGKKQYYKSGNKKGEIKKKIKTPEKYHYEIDIKTLNEYIATSEVVVVETPGTTFGNAAKATRTVHINYGKILAIAELNKCKIIKVPANKWKKDLEVTKDKNMTVQKAIQLSGYSFKTKRDRLLDGEAEAWLIGYWYITKYLKLNFKDIL